MREEEKVGPDVVVHEPGCIGCILLLALLILIVYTIFMEVVHPKG